MLIGNHKHDVEVEPLIAFRKCSNEATTNNRRLLGGGAHFATASQVGTERGPVSNDARLFHAGEKAYWLHRSIHVKKGLARDQNEVQHSP